MPHGLGQAGDVSHVVTPQLFLALARDEKAAPLGRLCADSRRIDSLEEILLWTPRGRTAGVPAWSASPDMKRVVERAAAMLTPGGRPADRGKPQIEQELAPRCYERDDRWIRVERRL